MAGRAGFEPARTVLETVRLPLPQLPTVGREGVEPPKRERHVYSVLTLPIAIPTRERTYSGRGSGRRASDASLRPEAGRGEREREYLSVPIHHARSRFSAEATGVEPVDAFTSAL